MFARNLIFKLVDTLVQEAANLLSYSQPEEKTELSPPIEFKEIEAEFDPAHVHPGFFSTIQEGGYTFRLDPLTRCRGYYVPRAQASAVLPENQYAVIREGNVEIFYGYSEISLKTYALGLDDETIQSIKWCKMDVSSDGRNLGIIVFGNTTHVWIIDLLNDDILYFKPSIERRINDYNNIAVKNSSWFYLCGNDFIELYEFDYKKNQALIRDKIVSENISNIYNIHAWSDNDYLLMMRWRGGREYTLDLCELNGNLPLKVIGSHSFGTKDPINYVTLYNSFVIYQADKIKEFSFEDLTWKDWKIESITKKSAVNIKLLENAKQDLVIKCDDGSFTPDEYHIHKNVNSERYRVLPQILADSLLMFSMDIIKMLVEYSLTQSRFVPSTLSCVSLKNTLPTQPKKLTDKKLTDKKLASAFANLSMFCDRKDEVKSKEKERELRGDFVTLLQEALRRAGEVSFIQVEKMIYDLLEQPKFKPLKKMNDKENVGFLESLHDLIRSAAPEVVRVVAARY